MWSDKDYHSIPKPFLSFLSAQSPPFLPTMATFISSVSGDDVERMFDSREKVRKELINYAKLTKGHYFRLNALTTVSAISGHTVDEGLVPVPKDVLQRVMRDFITHALNADVNGELNNWSCGMLGSRWMDMDASLYGCYAIRCAFYSKTYYEGKWKHDKPYLVQIMVEKE
jgi:hypothetical protein